MENIAEVLIGISGSGKSTYAKNKVENNPNWIRINRDSLRAMFFGDHLNGYYVHKDIGKREKFITLVQEELIEIGLYWSNKNIILDNTHLEEKYIKPFEIRRIDENIITKFIIFDCTLEEAKKRVLERDYPNTALEHYTTYIDAQYEKFQRIKEYTLKTYPNDTTIFTETRKK